uniref:BTB domain-containing protein n=1 Tax=Globodera rostochiensis TaxID=31243 RepID=A0A914I4S3_GLORO
MANIYDEFIIVDEKSVTDFTDGRCSGGCYFRFDRTTFAELEFTMVNSQRGLQIKDIASHPTDESEPLAQIVSWKWDKGTQKIAKVNNFLWYNRHTQQRPNSGDQFNDSPSILIRILKKREVIENPCPPFSSPDDDLTVHIGDRQVTVSAHWLMVVSPVIERMLSVEMKEKQQRTLNLDGHGITMEQFMQFLETVNDHFQHGRSLPNPTNVLVLLKLADYFQIDWLKERCEAHLINCVEIPLIERFLLIDRYRLNNLKNFFLRCLNAYTLSEFNHEQLLATISKEFSDQLTFRLSAKQ